MAVPGGAPLRGRRVSVEQPPSVFCGGRQCGESGVLEGQALGLGDHPLGPWLIANGDGIAGEEGRHCRVGDEQVPVYGQFLVERVEHPESLGACMQWRVPARR